MWFVYYLKLLLATSLPRPLHAVLTVYTALECSCFHKYTLWGEFSWNLRFTGRANCFHVNGSANSGAKGTFWGQNVLV